MRFDDILLALIIRMPISGYDARKWLSTEGMFLRANADQSQIYRTLHRLRKAGLVEQVREFRPAGPDAKVYSATEAGVQHILELAHSPFTPPPRWSEPDFNARYSLLGTLAPDTLPELIATELSFRKSQVVLYRNQDRRMDLSRAAVPIDTDVFDRISDASHVVGAAAMDQWIEWLEEQLAIWTEYNESHGSQPECGSASPTPRTP